MLNFLRRLFGMDSDESPSRPEGIERRKKPRVSAASVLATGPEAQADSAPQPDSEPEETAAEEAELSLEDPVPSSQAGKPGSDPYDTGAYNQPNAWSKSGKRRDN